MNIYKEYHLVDTSKYNSRIIEDNNEYYYVFNKLHNLNGYATKKNNCIKFFIWDCLMNLNGPASINDSGYKSYFLFNAQLKEEEFLHFKKNLESKKEKELETALLIIKTFPIKDGCKIIFKSKSLKSKLTLTVNLNNEIHSFDDKPALILNDEKVWFKNNKIHRDHGFAISIPGGFKFWFKDGIIGGRNRDKPSVVINGVCKQYWKENVLHSDIGPAIVYDNGKKEWWVNGERKRSDGQDDLPVITLNNTDNFGCWFKKNKLHREDKPAIISQDKVLWFVEGIELSNEEIMIKELNKNLKKTNLIKNMKV